MSSAAMVSDPSPTSGNTRRARAGKRSHGSRSSPSTTTMDPPARARATDRSESLTGRNQMVHTITSVQAALNATARWAPWRESCAGGNQIHGLRTRADPMP